MFISLPYLIYTCLQLIPSRPATADHQGMEVQCHIRCMKLCVCSGVEICIHIKQETQSFCETNNTLHTSVPMCLFPIHCNHP